MRRINLTDIKRESGSCALAQDDVEGALACCPRYFTPITIAPAASRSRAGSAENTAAGVPAAAQTTG
jgi:hypothetical protein